MADDDGGFGDWAEDEAPAAEEAATGGEEAVEEGATEEGATEDQTGEGEAEEEDLEPQEPERKLFWSKWERPKSHIYDYNYGYFNNYYSGMIDQITSGTNRGRPLAESWAERSMRMYSKNKGRYEAQADKDLELVRNIRANHNEYFRLRNEFTAREVGYHNQ